MTFEVPVAAVSRSRGTRGVAAMVALAASIVLVAAGAGWLAPPEAPSVQGSALAAMTTAAAPPGWGATRPVIPRIVTASVARSLPDTIACRDIEPSLCDRVVRAALRVLPADLPNVTRASVWRSLVCGDTFDCPPAYLRDSKPIASVILRFEDGSPGVAVNVVGWRYGTGIRLGLRAWLVRSTPATTD